jgi:hypothetical protein
LEISRAVRHTLLDLEWHSGWRMTGKSFSWFLCLSNFYFPSDFANVIDLGSFPNLRSFAIRCSKYGERLRVETLNDMLRTAAIDKEIETITIIMAPTTEGGLYYFLNDFRWGILDSLLRGERLKNLRSQDVCSETTVDQGACAL